MSYRPQIKKSDGTMQDLPLDAETVKGKNVSAEINNIISGAQVVGKATHAASADAATKATQDGNGNNIASTYATKSEIKKLYTHILHVVFSGDSNEYIIRYDIAGKTSLTDLSSFYYSIYQVATSSDTGYPINIKIGNEYISGVVYASKKDNYDALSFYYNGKTKTYKTMSDISIIRDAVIG